MSGCPACYKNIPWNEHWSLKSGIFSRWTEPCPHCGALLTPARTPWLLGRLGIAAWGMMALIIAMDKKTDFQRVNYYTIPLLILGIILMCVGTFSRHYVVVQDLSQTR